MLERVLCVDISPGCWLQAVHAALQASEPKLCPIPRRRCPAAEGATLQHLLSAVSQRPGVHTALSRDLVALWADEFSPALALLKRVFPPGLIRYLNQPRQQRAQQQKAAVPTAAAQRAAPSQQPAEGQVQQQVQQQAPAEGQAATALSATQQLVAAASTTPAPAVPAEGGAHLLPQKAQQAQQPAVPEAQQAVQQRPRSPPKGFVTPPPPPRTGTVTAIGRATALLPCCQNSLPAETCSG